MPQEFCKTPKGGMLDPYQSKRKWDEMAEKKDEIKIIHDTKGPEKFKLRMRISVKDLVTFRNRITQARQL